MQPDQQKQRFDQAEEILRRVRIPSQPAIIGTLSRETAAPQPDFKRIAALAGQDAAISARLFKLINSPLFGFSRKVDTIIQALALLGSKNFFKMILTACLRESLGGDREVDRLFWRHSLRAALAAEQVGLDAHAFLEIDGITPDHCYLAGLFHDCAVPILSKHFTAYPPCQEAAISFAQGVIVQEDQAVGTDHCIIGHLMARSWNLSDTLCKAVLYHHEPIPPEPLDPAAVKLHAVVQVADYLAYQGDYLEGTVSLLVEEEWEIEQWTAARAEVANEIGLEAGDLEQLRKDLHERFLAD